MHLVIPFAAVRAEAARAAAGTLVVPRLERLLARLLPDDFGPGSAPAEGAGDDPELALSMPHERAIAALRGWPVVDGLLPFAADMARLDDLPEALPGQGVGLLTPSHWHVGTEQISLTDPLQLELDAIESRVLQQAVAPLFEELGWECHWGSAGRWYAWHPSLARLPTASLDRVVGRNVDYWLNDHPDMRVIRRLQSEVQMLLHKHPVNDLRAQRDAPPVNSFWLSGTGPGELARQPLPRHVRVDDRLRRHALAEDWAAWREHWRFVDEDPVAELVAEAEAGKRVAVTLCGERTCRTWRSGELPIWRRLFGPRSLPLAPILETL